MHPKKPGPVSAAPAPAPVSAPVSGAGAGAADTGPGFLGCMAFSNRGRQAVAQGIGTCTAHSLGLARGPDGAPGHMARPCRCSSRVGCRTDPAAGGAQAGGSSTNWTDDHED